MWICVFLLLNFLMVVFIVFRMIFFMVIAMMMGQQRNLFDAPCHVNELKPSGRVFLVGYFSGNLSLKWHPQGEIEAGAKE